MELAPHNYAIYRVFREILKETPCTLVYYIHLILFINIGNILFPK